VIEKVVVDVAAESEFVDAVIHWAGGRDTKARFRRPVARLTQLEGHDKLLARIHDLRREGYTAERIAEQLNAEGWVTATQRNTFNGRLVRMILHRHGFVPRGPKAPPSEAPNDWTLADLAKELDMPLVTLYGWLRRGWLSARRVHGQWVVAADRDERLRLRLRRRDHPGLPN
jgi:hypothetical protein